MAASECSFSKPRASVDIVKWNSLVVKGFMHAVRYADLTRRLPPWHAGANQGTTPMHGTQQPERILRLPELLEVTGLSTSSVYRMMAEKKFPRPVRLGRNSVGWRSTSVQEWVTSRPEVEITERSVPPPVRNRPARSRGASRNARR